VAESESEVQCSSVIPNTQALLRDSNDNLLSATFQVYLEHQGRYKCSIVALSEGGNQIFSTFIDLMVIGKEYCDSLP
jgi:hypothetical protein